MTIYIVLLIAIFLYGLILRTNLNKKYIEIIFLFLSFFSFTLVLGLRGNSVGEDTSTYMNIFYYCQNIPLSRIFTLHSLKIPYFTQSSYSNTIEIGFFAWCKLIGLFTNNAQVFLFCTAGITCFLFAKFIYDNCSEDVFFPTIIFLCESPFMNSFNLAKEMMACAVALQAFKLIRESKFFKALVVLIIAFLIHNTAITTLAILIVVVLFKRENKRSLFNVAAIVALLLPVVTIRAQTSVTKFFPEYSNYYTHNYYQNSLGIGSIILISIEMIGIIYMYMKKFRISGSAEVSVLTLISIAFQIFGTKIVMFFRLAIYFRAYLLMFFNKLFDYLPINYRKWIKGVLIVLLILFYLSFATSSSRTYNFFWN